MGKNMKRYYFKGFFGDYGHIIEREDGSAVLYMFWWDGRLLHHKRYKSLKRAKIALGRMSDCYTIKQIY